MKHIRHWLAAAAFLALALAAPRPLFSAAAAAAGTGIGTAQYINVLQFGADNTGVADSAPAAKKAIAAAANGGTVFFPAGKYRLSETIKITQSGLTILGDGRGGSTGKRSVGTVIIMDSAGGGGAGAAFSFERCNYSGIKNLTITRAAGNQGAGAALRLEKTYHCFARELLLAGVDCGLDCVDGISPLVEDLDIKNPSGKYGIWVHGSGRAGEKHNKIDASLFFRVSGGTGDNTTINWLVVGPNVDGFKIEDARFVGGGRALLCARGDPGRGDVRPKYIYTDRFGCDHVNLEGIVIEDANDVFMTNTWIGQNKRGSGVVIGEDFTGPALIANIRIRGSGGHGMHIKGGRNIYIQNPLIGACATSRDLIPADAKTGCGILIEEKVTHLRVTGGGVCPLPEQGGRARQHHGIRYTGDSEKARRNFVGISGVDTAENPVPFEPRGLSPGSDM
ncbi:MAG: glycoside hydrolase family 55 protein [Opitutaceae bacterium]|nr:glycoside hydrolase family 55 protein [Opitutaceae bacterium]